MNLRVIVRRIPHGMYAVEVHSDYGWFTVEKRVSYTDARSLGQNIGNVLKCEVYDG